MWEAIAGGAAGRRARAGIGALLLVLLGGCQATFRQGPCEEFVGLADACYEQAGLDPFFEANVDCVDPVSSVREYRCLIEQYELASCTTPSEAYAAVEAASEECLGWSEPLGGDDDDSAR